MSRVGKQIITIPEKTEVTKSDGLIVVKGPLGELKREFKDMIDITIEGKEIKLLPKETSSDIVALWGTYASHLINMIKGVNTPYEKKLSIEGIGFKVELKGKDLNFALGFSHPIKVSIPEGLNVTTEKNTITISGIDKEQVGQFTAKVRALKKPEPYKGKGIRYAEEVVRRKQGKKST
ncbi:MAG: 50S ribosomal protein L6 [Patescibacteria group bacterium]|nr:50S ribosomal protein L6 [Patescibacteria group bacterium]